MDDRIRQAYTRDLHRRQAHSKVERRRREKISAAFETLQHIVPSSRNRGLVQKLSILENAIAYIHELEIFSGKTVNTINTITYYPSHPQDSVRLLPSPTPSVSNLVEPLVESNNDPHHSVESKINLYHSAESKISPGHSIKSNIMSISHILNKEL